MPAKYFRGQKKSGFFCSIREKDQASVEKSCTGFSNFFALYTTPGSSLDQQTEHIQGKIMTATDMTTRAGNGTQALQKIPLPIHLAGILLLIVVTAWCGPVASFL